MNEYPVLPRCTTDMVKLLADAAADEGKRFNFSALYLRMKRERRERDARSGWHRYGDGSWTWWPA